MIGLHWDISCCARGKKGRRLHWEDELGIESWRMRRHLVSWRWRKRREDVLGEGKSVCSGQESCSGEGNCLAWLWQTLGWVNLGSGKWNGDLTWIWDKLSHWIDGTVQGQRAGKRHSKKKKSFTFLVYLVGSRGWDWEWWFDSCEAGDHCHILSTCLVFILQWEN